MLVHRTEQAHAQLIEVCLGVLHEDLDARRSAEANGSSVHVNGRHLEVEFGFAYRAAIVERHQPVGEPEDLAKRVENPLATARDESGRIYVLDRDGERVLRFGPNLDFEAVIVDLEEVLHDR